jgi:hypothetical protein
LASVLAGACGPGGGLDSAEKPRIPDVPEVADAELQQQLHTLRAMAIEHVKLALPAEKADGKASKRLELLRHASEDLRRKCLEGLDEVDADAVVVKEFLQACASAIRADQP